MVGKGGKVTLGAVGTVGFGNGVGIGKEGNGGNVFGNWGGIWVLGNGGNVFGNWGGIWLLGNGGNVSFGWVGRGVFGNGGSVALGKLGWDGKGGNVALGSGGRVGSVCRRWRAAWLTLELDNKIVTSIQRMKECFEATIFERFGMSSFN